MAVAGQYDEPSASSSSQATRMVSFSEAMLSAVSAQNAARLRTDPSAQPVCIRVGVHTGAAVAATLGIRNPKSSFFGDTVNTASRCVVRAAPASRRSWHAAACVCFAAQQPSSSSAALFL